MHLNSSLLWQPWLLWGRMHREAATNSGIGVRPRVVKSDRFFLIHYRPPLLRSSSSPWFDLLFCFALLERCTARRRFRVCFSLSLYLLMFIPLWLITLLLTIFFLHLLIVFFLRGGIIGPTHKAASPEPCNVGRLLGDAWHIIRQHHS